jgi:predicted DNA-binding transcriptional regulator AlpA
MLARMRISRATLARWTVAGLPHSKVLGTVFFDPAEVDEWIRSQRVPRPRSAPGRKTAKAGKARK